MRPLQERESEKDLELENVHDSSDKEKEVQDSSVRESCSALHNLRASEVWYFKLPGAIKG